MWGEDEVCMGRRRRWVWGGGGGGCGEEESVCGRGLDNDGCSI